MAASENTLSGKGDHRPAVSCLSLPSKHTAGRTTVRSTLTQRRRGHYLFKGITLSSLLLTPNFRKKHFAWKACWKDTTVAGWAPTRIFRSPTKICRQENIH